MGKNDMDSGHNCKKRKSDDIERGSADRLDSKKTKKEKAIDRLSSLPDDLIHKILSFVSIKDAVQTIDVLSSRYRFIWTTLPHFNFSTEDFFSTKKFSKFVRQFLKRRDGQIDVYSMKLIFRGEVMQPFFKKLMDYAFSHNIQQLEVTCLFGNLTEFPLSLFSSLSLKHLSLEGKLYRSMSGRQILRATSTLELPALTALCLCNVVLSSDDQSVGFFSKCANLKNLTLKSYDIIEGSSSNFSICHHRGLVNLTLDEGLRNVKVVNVVAPQLENLIIRAGDNIRLHVISAPGLTSLVYDGYRPLYLSTDGFPCLKQANICCSDPYYNKTIKQLADAAHEIVCLLQQLCHVEFLTLNLEIIELLSSSVELISHQPSPFVNLKNSTIYPKKLSERDLPKGKVNLSTEVLVNNYLLGSSPGPPSQCFPEIIAMKDAKLAQKLMTSLQTVLKKRLLKLEQAETETNRAKIKNEMKMTDWEDVNMQIEKGKEKTCDILNCLREINDVMLKLPTSMRAEMLASFSSLCAEAETVVIKIIHRFNLQSNMRHFSVGFIKRLLQSFNHLFSRLFQCSLLPPQCNNS